MPVTPGLNSLHHFRRLDRNQYIVAGRTAKSAPQVLEIFRSEPEVDFKRLTNKTTVQYSDIYSDSDKDNEFIN